MYMSVRTLFGNNLERMSTSRTTSTSVHLIHARTEPHVWILLEVIAVIARLDTLEATVKQVL